MRVLIVTRIYPSSVEPHWAPFNRQQFRALAELCPVEILATVPWFPLARAFRRWSRAGRVGEVPRREIFDGLDVAHPRFVYIPRLHAASAALYAASLAPEVLRRRGRFDVLLASWAYPDGVSAVALARLAGVPAAIKVHGTDLNTVAGLPGLGPQLRVALPRAGRVIAVSRPLAERAIALGAPAERVDVVPNGVDASLFHPRERAAARRELGHAADRRRWLVYVGRLEMVKGVLELIEAFARLSRPDLRLVLVGQGEARAACERAAAPLGDRVLLAGVRPIEEIPLWLAASQALVLPSWNEGTPNVILEAFACGRRVVATRVGGVPDLVTSELLGELVPPRDPAALAAALGRAADLEADPGEIARAGSRGGWRDSATRLLRSLELTCAPSTRA
jgi:glycosyltransferase involved in cell wall biosynthesis